MKPFEILYLCLEPFMAPIHAIVRRRLKQIVRQGQPVPDILDVGGRKSHYTIGLPAQITISDLPRETDIQKRLNLGITQDIIEQTLKRRSNVREMLLDDMTQSKLPDEPFDCVVAVEVLEHVREDGPFIHHVHRVLKPGGVFLMTTPNADHPGRQGPVPEGNARYYTGAMLSRVLASRFERFEIDYAVPVGRLHTLSLRSWSLRHPLRTLVTMAASRLNQIKAADEKVKQMAVGTRHLVATARKADDRTS